MKKRIICLIIVIICLTLAGCSIPFYSELDIEDIEESAYADGYSDGQEKGYDEGYEVGKNEGYEYANGQYARAQADSYNSSIPMDGNYTGEDSTAGVYTTPSGDKYHRAGCRYVDGRYDLTRFDSISSAEEAGYDACSVCFN